MHSKQESRTLRLQMHLQMGLQMRLEKLPQPR
jgi:hypothetical protein